MIDKDKIFNQDISKYIFYETESGIVLNGDCLEILPLINNFKLLITDPPYEQCLSGGGSIAKKFNYRRESLNKISKFNPLEFLKKILSFKNQEYIVDTKKNTEYHLLTQLNLNILRIC